MVMDTGRLSLGLLIASLVLLIVAAATPYWACGNIYADCFERYRSSEKAVILSVLILYTLGLLCLAIVILFDFISCCMSVRDQICMAKARTILLFLGIAVLIMAVLLFTAFFKSDWSYLAAVVGCVFALQVAIITIMTSSCVATHHAVPVRA